MSDLSAVFCQQQAVVIFTDTERWNYLVLTLHWFLIPLFGLQALCFRYPIFWFQSPDQECVFPKIRLFSLKVIAEFIYKNSKSSICVFISELVTHSLNWWDWKWMDSHLNHQLNNRQFGWWPNGLANMCLSVSRSPDDAVMLSGLKIHVLTKAGSVL